MIIAPSVLSLDYTKFNEQLDLVNKHANWLHFDVMDGYFVQNMSLGTPLLKQIRQNSNLFLDVHLMVLYPDIIYKYFVENGADMITFHYESYKDLQKCKALIYALKKDYIKVGISVKPKTSIKDIEELLKYVDNVLVMSVEPGFGGQEFIQDSIHKISYLKNYKEQNKLNYTIQVDGGINDVTAFQVLKAGCDCLVAGSYIFKGDIVENINKLKKINV